MPLYKNIKQSRLQLSMTQKTLAKRIGVVDTMISLYENNERTPSLEVLIKLAAVLGVSLDLLLADEVRNASKDIAPASEPSI